MRPDALPTVTRGLRATPTAEARRLAARALRAATAEEVERELAVVLAAEHGSRVPSDGQAAEHAEKRG